MTSSIEKLKVYLDSGANIKNIKHLDSCCDFITFPFDDKSARRKKICKLGHSSSASWKDMNVTWEECRERIEESREDKGKIKDIKNVIGHGPEKHRDTLHLDSAYRSGCLVFLTSDKKDIWKYRNDLKKLLGIEVFHFPSEQDLFIEFIKTNISNINQI